MRITNIVFTKNRPLQLHGYLESMLRFFPSDKISMTVLYKSELFSQEYANLFSEFSCVNVVREKDFHRDLLSVIENIKTEYVFFGVDDVAFFDGVSLDLIEKTFASHNHDLLGFSLRLGLEQVQNDVKAGNVMKFQWQNQEYHLLDWTRGQSPATCYPFELCATVYRTTDIQRLIKCAMKGGELVRKLFAPASPAVKILSRVYSRKKLLKYFGYFYNPNTFESWCCRYVQRHKDEFGHFLGFQKTCATAIQVNLVNTSTNTDWVGDGDLTVEMLNEQYKNGKRLDIDYIIGKKPKTTHVDRDYFRLS